MVKQPSSFFATTAVDHAVAGLGAGVITTLCLNPLDLIKIRFQVNTGPTTGGVGRQMLYALRDIHLQQGWQGLYRGFMPNVAGNASSWGLYFLFYNMLKKRVSGGDPNKKLSNGEYLLCSAEASAATAVITNPFWLVRVRMFATARDTPNAYRGLWDGLSRIVRADGVQGLFRGTTLGLVGVSNGAIQFMVYERMKAWGFDRRRKQAEGTGKAYVQDLDKLTNLAYAAMSIGSKIVASSVTYPYQVVRSRMQNNTQQEMFPNISTTIVRTWKQDGFRGFYRGLGPTLLRILPGTCITFVVYENLAWLLRTTAARRDAKKRSESQDLDS